MDSALHDHLADMGVRHWWYRGRREVVRAVLDTHLPPKIGRQLLEVGAGTGSVTTTLVDFGSVTAVEPHGTALQACRRLVPSAQVVPGDLETLGSLPTVGDRTFDVVCAFDVIEHVRDDVAALEALRHRVVDGGRLVVTVPALELLWGAHDEINGHYRRYARPQLVRSLHHAGFDVRFASYFSAILFPAVAAVRIGRRIVGANTGPASDFRMPRPLVNDVLTHLFGIEAGLVRRGLRLSIGSSLVAVAAPR